MTKGPSRKKFARYSFLFLACTVLIYVYIDTPVTGYDYEIIDIVKHDSSLFTQGLTFEDGKFFESSGPRSRSKFVVYEKDSSHHNYVIELPKEIHAEGSTIIGKQIFILSWQQGICYVYDLNSMKYVKEFEYNGEGWGLTHDGQLLIMSDGSDAIVFRDKDTFNVVKTINVSQDGIPVRYINELEYINGRIWANLWRENRIIEINPANGVVTGFVDLSDLVKQYQEFSGVLNGIAYEKETDSLWVTGKNWDELYKLRVINN